MNHPANPHRLLHGASARWLLLAVMLLTAALHALGFGGYWISDDFGNIHQLHAWADQGRLWAGLAEKMTEGNTPAGAFYRPSLQLVRGLSWLLAGPSFTGWFALSWLLHLLNTALVMSLVTKLLGQHAYSPVAAALAGALFGLSPLTAEGVYWIAAGGDTWVTFLALLALHCWFGRAPLLVPVLFLAALGFKESAAVLPLQMVLLLAIPSNDGRKTLRWWAAGICLALLLGYFVLRGALFGEVWRVYTHGQSAGLLEAIRSLPGWWAGLTSGMDLLALAYLLPMAAAALLALGLSFRQRRVRLLLVFGACTFGLLLATLLNLGGLLPSGEGGRLFLTPMAWFAITAGIALAPDKLPLAYGARIAVTIAVAAGTVMLGLQYAQLRSTQESTRDFLEQVAEWPANHSGTTLLILPEQAGRLPVFRNAQSGIVMPPVQSEPLLHRVIPTLDHELGARHAQIAAGLITQIDRLRPSEVDWRTVGAMLQPAPARWPDHYACWSWRQPTIQPLQAPAGFDNEKTWLADLARQAEQICGLSIPGGWQAVVSH